jgi:RNA 2',3'-cyclic 3'-phosphodiesterase
MRLFVGLDIPEDIRERMRAYVDDLKSRGAHAKWTNPDGWHITLKFIGWTKRDAEIREALKKISAAPFEIGFQDVGFFTPEKPRIFYDEINAPPALTELAGKIDQALVTCGVEAEKRPYSPHLTFARTGSGRPHGTHGDRDAPTMKSLQQLVERTPELQHPDFGTMTANEFVLYLSELSPKGAKYIKLETYPLGG